MNVLIVSAHPDDESFGAAGALLKHAARGDRIFWLIVTAITLEAGYDTRRIKSRSDEIKKVAGLIGISEVFSLSFPTTRLTGESLVKLVPEISRVIGQLMPERIYVPNRSDIHSDHRITFDAVISASKTFRHPCVREILMYECLSETEFAPALHENAFLPNFFIDITGYLDKKMEVLGVYASELGEHPFPRSLRAVEALALLRGATAGVTHAESFQLIKFIES